MPDEKDIETKEEPRNEAEPAKEPKAEVRNVPKYTDEDVDRIIGDRFTRWQKQFEAQLKQREDDLTESQKLEKMNEQEKAQYEHEKLMKENQELRAQLDFREQKNIARDALAESGIVVNDALLSMIVSADADKTKNAIDSFTKLFNEAVNKGVTDSLKRNPPKAEPPKHEGKSAGVIAAEKANSMNVPK